MALFQPINVIPSSFTVGVVDAAKDIAQVSWQVNGNSPMTAYKIDFYAHNPDDDPSISLLVKSTEKTSAGIPAGGFYGTDRFGRPKMFTWKAEDKDETQTWSNFKSEFVNNRYYKFKITQYWREGGVEKSVEQMEYSVFATRKTPECSIERSASSDFSDPVAFSEGSTLPASIGHFVGKYTQAQGAPVREVRWQIATWVNGGAGEILADTGDVETQTLQYSFDGFFIGNEYAVRCSGKADYQTYGTQNFDSGWVNFTANAEEQGKYASNLTVTCLKRENSVLLQWENSGTIPANFQPEEDVPPIDDGSVFLKAGSSIVWDHEVVYDEANNRNIDSPMNYAVPWTAVLKIKPSRGVKNESKPVSGIASREVTEKKSVTLLPDQPAQQSGTAYLTSFTIRPLTPYTSVELAVPVSISVPPYQLVSYTSQSNRDGSITITTRTIGRPTRAIVDVVYRGHSITQTLATENDILSYSVRIDASIVSTTIHYMVAQLSDRLLQITLYGRSQNAPVLCTVSLTEQTFVTQGTLLEIGGSGQTLELVGTELQLCEGETTLGKVDISALSSSFVAIITPKGLYAITYNRSGASVGAAVSYTQKAIESVTVSGGDAGVTVDSVSIFQGSGSNIPSLYLDDQAFEPVWNSSAYTLYMSANFDSGIYDGGVGTSTMLGFKLYRQEVGSSALTPLASLKSTETSLKDYGIRSRKQYKYLLFAYDSNQAFMSSVQNDTVVATCFKSYSLLVCDYDSENDAYHVRKQYLFALNLSAGSVGNNNSPTLNANYTPYPTRMPSTQNYASGTLQGLIGAIYTVPALVEEVNGYKYTERPSTVDYFDNVDLEKELYDLSVTPYTLFMQDMKGHLRMVATNNQISMTPDLKKRQIPLTMSFPWVEIGDASDVTIIQTPNDDGWESDVPRDIRLSVDPETGALTANYPKPYDSAKFYLTGVKSKMK